MLKYKYADINCQALSKYITDEICYIATYKQTIEQIADSMYGTNSIFDCSIKLDIRTKFNLINGLGTTNDNNLENIKKRLIAIRDAITLIQNYQNEIRSLESYQNQLNMPGLFSDGIRQNINLHETNIKSLESQIDELLKKI